MNEIQKIAHNTIIQVIGKIIVTGLALIGFGMITRYLGQEGFGFFATIFAFLAIFSILVDLGLQMTTSKIISDPQEDESEILSNALTIRVITSVLFLGIAPIIILFFPYPAIVKTGATIAALGFIFSSSINTITSFFQKNLIMQKVVIAEITAKIIYLTAIIYVINQNFGLLGIVAATVLDSFAIFMILFYFASKTSAIKPSFNLIIWKKILNQTWPIALTIALNLIYFKGDIFIMSLIKTPEEVGLYGAPYRVVEVLIHMAFLFLGLILPLLSTAYAINNFDRLKKIIQTSFDFLIILTVPMIVGGYFLGDEIMLLMAGPDFAISGEIIKILFIATGTIFLASLFGYVIVAINQQKKMIKFYAFNAIVSIIGYSYFIYHHSYWGAAWMTVATEVFILLGAYYVMQKEISFSPNATIVIKSILASLIMAIPLYYISSLNLFIQIGLGAMTYLMALYIFKGYDKALINEIVRIKQ